MSVQAPAGQQDSEQDSEQRAEAGRRVVQRAVFPADRDADTVPLYVDFNSASPAAVGTQIAPGPSCQPRSRISPSGR